jgi:hypothetical protein
VRQTGQRRPSGCLLGVFLLLLALLAIMLASIIYVALFTPR